MDEITSIMLAQIHDVNQRDENQMLAELAGETVEDYIYEVKTGGKRTVKLSWAGTMEMARSRGNITLSDPSIIDNDGYVRIVVRGTDLTRNFSIFGGCRQPKKQNVKIFDADGNQTGYQEQDDPHYFTKALSKAQRNVLQAVIPADFAARMIDRFLVKAGKQPLKQLPKGKTPSRSRINTEVAEPAEFENMFELEKYVYDRYHIQPADLYRELGYKSRAECNEPPWDCYLKIKASMEG